MDIIKRNGTKVPFDKEKVFNAISSANDSVKIKHKLTKTKIREITDSVSEAYESGSRAKSVETVQDMVEEALVEAGAYEVVKAYILYRKHHEKLRDIKTTMLNYKSTMDDYLNIKDWRVKENATVTYSVGGLILSNSGTMTANYWLSEVYDEEIAKAHKNAEIHIHDLSMLTGYCAGWSLKQLIQEGLGGVPGKITSTPASHLSTLCNQMVNFLGIMQNEWAG